MSGIKDWNTKDIRDFKTSFGKRNDRSFFSSEPPHDPNRAYDQAREMLRKRWSDAMRTLASIPDQPVGFGPNSLLAGLNQEEGPLSRATDTLIQQGPGVIVDVSTTRLIQQTDLWIDFEARCISARNEMQAGQSDAAVRQKLADRTNQLWTLILGMQAEVRLLSPRPDIGAILRAGQALTQEAGADGAAIVNTADFAKRIEDCKAQVRAISAVILENGESDRKEAYCRLQLKQLYGLDIDTSSSTLLGVQQTFPFEDLLEVLAMVPPDHSLNAAMTTVKSENAWMDYGGSYEETPKRINMNLLIEMNFIGKPYTDPESGDKKWLHNWKTTALHEIGHAVDAAYNIMGTHGGKPGCGEWAEEHPIVFLTPQHIAFVQAMTHCGITDRPFTDHLDDLTLRSIVANVALGNQNPGQARADMQRFWDWVYDLEVEPPIAARETAVMEALVHLAGAVDEAFPDERPLGDFDHDRGVVLATAAAHVTTLTTGVPPAFAADAFWQQVRNLVDHPEQSAGTVRGWLFQQLGTFNPAVAQLRAARVPMVTAWVNATEHAMPPPVDLSDYRAAAKPWGRDISGETIAGVPAAQEAYKGSLKWWRYSGTDRGSTSVSTYQWRAPGEWFAELYAITWFKKVEPPAAVGKDVRPYLFGGHITPEQAI